MIPFQDSACRTLDQTYCSLRTAIRQGHLVAGVTLPSSRAIAAALGFSPNTVGVVIGFGDATPARVDRFAATRAQAKAEGV